MTRITGTLHEDQYTFLIISRLVILKIRNISNKSCVGNEDIHFMLINVFRDEIMWKNIVQPGRPEMTIIIWHLLVACWITKGTNTHSVTYESGLKL